ncbi:MAG: hypothetical protein Q8R55_07940 [Candidatus Taylorbacteria bacterium]|nr:hypothetical protein [Candidatus Taylorbacteria bacterium]
MRNFFVVFVVVLLSVISSIQLTRYRIFAQQSYDGPLNQVRTGSCSNGNRQITVNSKVSLDQSTKEYTYWYKLSNTGTSDVYVRWENVDRMLTLNWATPHIFLLAPGDFEEFTLKTREGPMLFGGKLTFFENDLPLTEQRKKLTKQEVGVTLDTTSKNALVAILICGQSGPLPPLALER